MCASVCCRRDELLFRGGFWLSLRTKRASSGDEEEEEEERKKTTRQTDRARERERERGKERAGERENVFATACLLAFDSRRSLVKKEKEARREKQKPQRGPPCPGRLATARLTSKNPSRSSKCVDELPILRSRRCPCRAQMTNHDVARLF